MRHCSMNIFVGDRHQTRPDPGHYSAEPRLLRDQCVKIYNYQLPYKFWLRLLSTMRMTQKNVLAYLRYLPRRSVHSMIQKRPKKSPGLIQAITPCMHSMTKACIFSVRLASLSSSVICTFNGGVLFKYWHNSRNWLLLTRPREQFDTQLICSGYKTRGI